jgi:hypothetical protein
MYGKYQPSFSRCGLDADDIFSLSKLYSIYYFDIYSSDVSKEENKQRNALITFIRQRMDYLARTCEKKAENFNISKNLSGYYAKTEKSVEAPDDVIIGNPSEWGYRKVYPKELNQIFKDKKGSLKDAKGFEVVKLQFFDSITPDEYENILYNESFTLESPEDILVETEEKQKINESINDFEAKSMVNKIKQLRVMKVYAKTEQKKKDIDRLIRLIEKNERNNLQ